ncbi:MAG: hypothetical protein ACKOC5_03900 [Chloroflexota bacterium]
MNKNFHLAASAVLGAGITHFLFVNRLKVIHDESALAALLLALMLLGIFSLLAYQLLFQYALPQLDRRGLSRSSRLAWLGLALLSGFYLVYTIPLNLYKFSGQPLYVVSATLAIGLTLFLVSVTLYLIPVTAPVLAAPSPAAGSRRTWRLTLLYMLPMLAAWGIFLLAFWPGVMTPDAIDQWNQVQTKSFNDFHPATHTLSI